MEWTISYDAKTDTTISTTTRTHNGQLVGFDLLGDINTFPPDRRGAIEAGAAAAIEARIQELERAES